MCHVGTVLFSQGVYLNQIKRYIIIAYSQGAGDSDRLLKELKASPLPYISMALLWYLGHEVIWFIIIDDMNIARKHRFFNTWHLYLRKYLLNGMNKCRTKSTVQYILSYLSSIWCEASCKGNVKINRASTMPLKYSQNWEGTKLNIQITILSEY